MSNFIDIFFVSKKPIFIGRTKHDFFSIFAFNIILSMMSQLRTDKNDDGQKL